MITIVFDYFFYAFMNAVIMATVMHYFGLPVYTIGKVAFTSFVLMVIRMHLLI